MQEPHSLRSAKPVQDRGLGRARLDIEAKLSLIDGESRCKLIDLSLDGAKIATDRELYCGEAAILKIDGLEAFGSIIWASEGFAGLQFDERASKERLLYLQSVAKNHEKFVAREAAQRWASGSS